MLGRLKYVGVPGLPEWIGADGGHDPQTIVINEVPALHLGAVLDFLWEDFVEVDGAILRRRFVEDGSVDAWESKVRTVRDLESVANHLHLWDIPKYTETNVPVAFLEGVAEIIADMWLAKAQTRFPDRRFLAEATKAEEDYGPTVYLEQDDSDGPVPFRPWVTKDVP